ncbi:HK97 family phage major capsid protein [Leifsonia sp. EB41]|uniref:phage major capsid protein n=1 Tax=Leifsonia sp. EB41 TaxID=3156260 RepID=UPI0035178044
MTIQINGTDAPREVRIQNPGSSILGPLGARRQSLIQERDGILNTSTPQTFTPAVEARVGQLNTEIDALEERQGELQRQAQMEDNARRARAAFGPARIVRSEEVYRPDRPELSFFMDLRNARSGGDWAAAERLSRHQAAYEAETRALSTQAGAGGQFAPPAWLVDEWVGLARPGRITADRLNKDELPSGVSSINLPKVASGESVAVQATQNTAVSSTDLTTNSVSSGITTLAGQQVIALQLIQQSGIAFDKVIGQDLMAEYAKQLDLQVLNGSGASGQLQGLIGVAGVNAITYTQATPTVGGAGQFLAQINQAVLAVNTNRFLPPSGIIMHPRRWSWVLNANDNQGRPLVVPSGDYAGFNTPGSASAAPTAQGAAGSLFGLPVYVDANVPTNLGAGTNQDVALVGRFEDSFLWETAPAFEAFDAPYANQMSILFRVSGYAAMIANRYPASLSIISGTGLVTPTF